MYILVNKSMPGLVKIGMTTRCVEGRAHELYQTGVPTPFKVYDIYKCPNCAEVERRVHEELSGLRVNEAREFFKCDPEIAASSVRDQHREQVENWLDDFIPGVTIVDDYHFIDEGDVAALAYTLGADSRDVCAAFYLMTADEFRPVLDRFKTSREKIKARHNSGADSQPFTVV